MPGIRFDEEVDVRIVALPSETCRKYATAYLRREDWRSALEESRAIGIEESRVIGITAWCAR